MSGREIAGVLLLAVLAALLRFHAIGAASYWTDEFFSLQQSNGFEVGALDAASSALRKPAPRLTQVGAELPWPQVIEQFRTDNHPPLYFICLRLWRRVAADGEAATRAPSAVFSLLGLGLAWVVVRRRAGPWPGLVCAALLAVSASQIRYAQEARGYSMAVAFVMLAVLAVERLEAGASRRLWSGVLGASALSAMLTHYYAAGALAGLATFAILALPRAPRRAAVAAFAVAGIVFVALWGPVLWKQRQHVLSNNGWTLRPEAGHGLATLERLGVWPAEVLAGASSRDAGAAWAAGALGWIALAFAARERANRLWLSVIAGSVLLVLAVDIGLGGRQLEIPRYTLFAAPAVAAALAAVPGRIGTVVPALVFVGLVARLPAVWIPDRPPWREFARLVSAEARPREAVMVVGALRSVDAEPLSVYQALIHYAWASDRPFGFLRGRPNRALRQALRHRGTALIVCMPDVDLSGFLPFRVEEELEYSSDMPRLLRVSFEDEAP